MNVKYRGSAYTSENNFLEVKETDLVGGKYRGCEWNYQLPRHVVPLRPKIGLQYRGISYCTNPVLTTKSDTPVFVGPHSEIKAPSEKRNRLHDVHLDNLRRNLERRIKAAQEENNESLLLMLKKESLELELV